MNIPAPKFFAELELNVEFIIKALFPTMKIAPPSLSFALLPSNMEFVTFTLCPYHQLKSQCLLHLRTLQQYY